MTTQRVLDAIPEGDAPSRDTFTTSNGVRFKVRPVPSLLTRDAGRRFELPVPPMVHIEDKETDEENPNDPKYLRELEYYRREVGELMNGIMLSRGTEIEFVPDNIEGPDGPNWAEDVTELAGLTIPAAGRRRYLAWVKYVALPHMDDFADLLGAITRASGMVREVDVAEAAAEFPDNSEGDADPGLSPTETDGRGDSSIVRIPRNRS